MFIFPDRPANTLGAAFLDHVSIYDYFATLKIDGWRCIVTHTHGLFDYRSRANKNIVIPDTLRQSFEANFKGVPDFILDTELTGNRRKGDAEGIVVLEALEYDGVNYRKEPAIDRWQQAYSRWPQLTVQAATSDFAKFFVHHKEHTPLAEGIVLKKRSSKLIGSSIACADNPAWTKCKWRAGSSGLSPTEY